MAILRNAASRAIIVCALFILSPPATAEPQNGWWWNPNESGRGYFIEMTGGVFYLAGYFYDSNGRATWMSASGAVTDLYSITGTLQSYRNGQSMFGAYRRPDAAVDVGSITINFADDSHGTMTWPGGTVPIERQVFNEDETFVDAPKTGWWWNSAESGSGYSVEIQGNSIFVVAFMYDESGNPIWYLTAGAMSSPTHFEGDWLEYAGGQTMAGPYRAPTSRNLGRVTIDFTAIDRGTITFTEGGTAKRVRSGSTKSPKAGRSRGPNPIAPQLPAPVWTEEQMWPYFACSLTRTITTTDGTYRTTGTWSYVVYFRFSRQASRAGNYEVNDALSYIDYNFRSTGPGCTETASLNHFRPLFGGLYIDPYGLYYRGTIYNVIVPLIRTTEAGEACGDPKDVAVPLEFSMTGGISTVQRPNPYPTLPPPFMRVRNSHVESDGSIEWGWDCDGLPPS